MAPLGPHPERRPAVITGASSGIGAAAAIALAELGFPVVLGARRLDECEKTAAALREDGHEAVALQLDLTDPESMETFISAAEEDVGPIEVLVSCAGDVLPSYAADTEPDDFAAQIDLNLLGSQRLIARLVPAMIERRRGDIVFVTSDVVRAPRPRMSSYVTAKWGLEGLARAMQLELERTGVRASIVRPGPTLTGMGLNWDPAIVDGVLAEWKRFGLVRHGGYLTSEGVAGAIVAVVTAPRGTHFTLLEVEPEAPLRREQEPET